MSGWQIERTSPSLWLVGRLGETMRLTEDGTLRFTESGLEYRIIERAHTDPWTDPLIPPAVWSPP